MMTSRPRTPSAPTNTAALSLLELRRHLLRKAGTLRARAHGLKVKGADSSAAKLSDESQRLVSLARTMAESEQKRENNSD